MVKYKFFKILVFLLVILSFSQNIVLAQSPPTILITYHTQSGKTQAMAEAVAKGVEEVQGVGYILKPIAEVTEEEILNASAIILGSPVYNANMAPQVQEFINSWPFDGRPLKGKIGAVFVTGGGFSIGEEAVMFSMIRSMMIHGMIIVGGEEVEAAFGASAITGEGDFAGKEIDQLFLKKAEGLGRRVGEMVLKNR
ncbi:flavodoxin family protein [Cecembia calidifontis]|jgi:NAD(P)H dehydrogenase (quinone)|uniref:NAD(P)H dehydrogenase (Quinone) n=1 Tax=Cecembia calidifontis TaxID=1187080 RepID=A0A4Q7PA50_9BACT|nr:flavodoxin family protein [Cecembia calidifontis]RZS97045.1 NAD(P)H dehydrogenase (quinone) [Cecembia calidifontis]